MFNNNNNNQNQLPINTIFNGDCVVGMQSMANESVDSIITDPPYLVNYTDRSGRSVAGDSSYNAKWLDPACREMFRVLKNDSYAVVFFGANHIEKFVIAFKKAGFRIAGQIAFVKKYSSSKKHLAYNHENAFLLIKGNPQLPQNPLSSVITGWEYTQNTYHPTQKPVNILSLLIKAYSKQGDTILDPFMGSGSTAIASITNGRNYLGFELDTKYHGIAIKRIDNWTKQQANYQNNSYQQQYYHRVQQTNTQERPAVEQQGNNYQQNQYIPQQVQGQGYIPQQAQGQGNFTGGNQVMYR